jgi:hypothetical protein
MLKSEPLDIERFSLSVYVCCMSMLEPLSTPKKPAKCKKAQDLSL